MPMVFGAIDEDDPDPNNTRVVLGRILNWLVGEGAGGPIEAEPVGVSTPILCLHPNPSRSRIGVTIDVSTCLTANWMRIDVLDPAGRRVAGLFEGSLAPGRVAFVWDGRSGEGTAVGSGVYFIHLRTAAGGCACKTVLLD